MALAPPSAGACRTGSVILTAKLIAGHDAQGERREPGPRRSGCRRGPRSESRVGDGHRAPGSFSGPEPGRRPCPGTPPRSRPLRPRPPGRRRMRLPRASISPYSGITLSDEGGQGELTRTRYGRQPTVGATASTASRLVVLATGAVVCLPFGDDGMSPVTGQMAKCRSTRARRPRGDHAGVARCSAIELPPSMTRYCPVM